MTKINKSCYGSLSTVERKRRRVSAKGESVEFCAIIDERVTKGKRILFFIVSFASFTANCQPELAIITESSLTSFDWLEHWIDVASHAQFNHLVCSMIYDVVSEVGRKRTQSSHHWIKTLCRLRVCWLKMRRGGCVRGERAQGKNHRKPVGALISRWVEYLLFHFWNSCRVVIFLSLAIVFVLFPDNSWRIFPCADYAVVRSNF